MEEDVLNALQSRAAYLPGGFDRDGRIIIVVNVVVSDLQQLWNKKYLEISISYIKKSLSPEILQKGLTVIVDAQKCSSRITRSHSRTIFSLFGDAPVNLFLVRPEGFWEKHVEPCTKSHTKGEPIVLSKQRLFKYFDPGNLPQALGGTLQYNYDVWLQQRKSIEEFRKTYEQTLRDMENLHVLLSDNKSLRPSEADHELKSFTQMHGQVQRRIEGTIEMGNRVLARITDAYQLHTNSDHHTPVANGAGSPSSLTAPSTSSSIASSNHSSSGGGGGVLTIASLPPDLSVERSRIELMLNKIEKKQTDIRSAWLELENSVREARELATLEEGVAFVTNWILGTAELMLNRKQTIGCDVKACEELRREHNTLEMECRETYGFYAELLYKIESYATASAGSSSKESLAYKDLMSQKDFMNFVCRSFATRLERRRNVLITSLRFYRLVMEYFDRTSVVFESLVMGNKVEDFEAAAGNLQKLKDSQQSLEIIERELVKEGEKLSDMLAMPVKDALGRDLGIDYSDDIANIRDILDTTIARRNMFSDSVELQKLTLEQVTHIHTYEQDARMAIKWMDDLYNVMIKCHSHVGCNIHEIQVQKDELQTFQETGKSIYNYGFQLLEASQTLRISCKLDTEVALKMSNQLKCTWHSLQTISQEHMTRLRVSAVFHRSVEEYCNKLHDLKISVIAVVTDTSPHRLTSEIEPPEPTETMSDVEPSECRRNCLRKYLALRERLLVEVGRMVRLGRLLKSRLKEPFMLDVATGKSAMTEHLSGADVAAVNGSSSGSSEATTTMVCPTGNNAIACTAITNKLTEIAEVAESLDAALRETQHDLDLIETNSSPSEKKLEHMPSSSSEDWYSRSTEDESFVTASEGNFTPHSHSSSFQTASGRTSSFISSGKNSFDASDAEDAPQLFPMQMSEIVSPVNVSFDSSDHSFLSAEQSPTVSDASKHREDDSGYQGINVLLVEEQPKQMANSRSNSVVDDPESVDGVDVNGNADAGATAAEKTSTPDNENENEVSVCESTKQTATWQRNKYYANITRQTIKGFL